MMDKIFHKRLFVVLILFCFVGLIAVDSFPQQESSQKSEIKKLIEEGKTQYKQGEYDKALINFLEAENLLEGMEREGINISKEIILDIYFYLALTYYSSGDSERNRERCLEYLNRWLAKNPKKSIDELSYPQGFIELLHLAKSGTKVIPKDEVKAPAEQPEKQKTDSVKKETKSKMEMESEPEKKPVIRKRQLETEKPTKKKKTPWIVIGGTVLALGTVAAVLLLGGPSTGSIQVNSTPSGAKVYLDGEDTGQVTNCNLSDIEKGNHTIKLVKEGYVDYQQSITVEGGQTETISANLNVHTINITSPANGTTWYSGETVIIEWNTGNGLNLQTFREDMTNIGKNGISYYDQATLLMWHMKKETRRHGKLYQREFNPLRSIYSEVQPRIGKKSVNNSFKTVVIPSFNMIKDISTQRRMRQNMISTIPSLRPHLSGERSNLTDQITSQNDTKNSQPGELPFTISNVKIDLYQGGSWIKTISSSTTNDGSHTWTIPDDIAAMTGYKVRISCVGEEGVYGESSEFEIVNLLSSIAWVEVPAGWFKMGDNFNEGKAHERPVHDVYLNGYYISKYEITFDQYDSFCDATGRSKPSDNGWGRGNMPVINVSWHDAKAYCDWLSDKTVENIHIPTEAQWEKAARGTEQRRYPWGNGSPNSTLANYNRNVNKPRVVGSYSAGISPYGAHDMAGNIWEWVYDWYAANYYGSSPSNNPQGPSSGSVKIHRGGSYDESASTIRSAYRAQTGAYPGNKYINVGIRICREK
ncbi:MAG: SUMF1/EgtB/PvdO family nonheme iron enzyme [Candidatus Aminicenantes bacterium]|nr:SUMF1/EgtB/PvdO family nonheme iron enzyme [Candidatus Aminicenantes bacterium]